LVSNEQAYLAHFISIFEELWKNGVQADERIGKIERGIEPEFFEVLTNTERADRILSDLAKSVTREALLLLPNDKAMLRADRLGVVDAFIKSSQQNGAIIKIICPLTETNADIMKKITINAPNIRILNGANSSSGFFIADNSKFLGAELRDPKAGSFMDAIGFTTYSNSVQSIESFKSIFELLWNERMLNEELKMTHMMQKEFINIAARAS
jgi:two-component system sensor histidine kinase VicK